MKNKENRNEMVLRLQSIENEAKYLRSRIDVMDYNNRMEEAKKYLGKYYKSNENSPQYVFVYDICKINCQPISLDFYYSKDTSVSGVINIGSSYFPNDEFHEWIEISKEEFMVNYLVMENAIKRYVK